VCIDDIIRLIPVPFTPFGIGTLAKFMETGVRRQETGDKDVSSSAVPVVVPVSLERRLGLSRLFLNSVSMVIIIYPTCHN
jgi:hypothetical protein